ncbi:MAG: dockerin type I domain-containing protein [Lachnospirales bacterium]
MKKFLALLLTLSMIPVSLVSANAAVWGDANSDGALTADDVSAVIQNVLSKGEYISAADVDGNGVIDSKDAAIILQKVLDKNYTMPVEESTEITTEEPTEVTTEEVTEITTAAPDDGVVRSDYELTAANFAAANFVDPYITMVIKPGTANGSNDTRIRLSKNIWLEFELGEGANVYVTAKHASTSSDDIRSISLSGPNGQVSKEEYFMGVDYEERLYGANLPAGAYSIKADNSVNITSVRITFDTVETSETTTEVTTEDEIPSEITTTGNAVYVTDFDELKAAVAQTNVDVYVQNDIDCTATLSLNTRNANVNIIGVTKEDGTSPSINFASYRDSSDTSGESKTGIRMGGSYYNLENLIIENAPDCGMRIKGSKSGHALIKDCVFRYNNNSGVSITGGGEYNTFIGVDSYRNGDIVQKLGSDADGFSVKLEAGERNYFYNCRSFENSDDGWDSFDYADVPLVGKIYYIECLAWNNGQASVFTGEYDYDAGNPLDKNLLYVKQLIKEDPDFETKYNNRLYTTYSTAGANATWPKTTISLLGGSETYERMHSANWNGNPNGFKFGSVNTTVEAQRYIENCIAFDNTSKGYDQNNAKATIDVVNGISFDNGRNYWMGDMTIGTSSGHIYSFSNKESDRVPTGMTLETPDESLQTSIREAVHAYRDSLKADLNNNIIPGVRLTNLF